ncbi:MAG: DUF4270 domain-containing protein [Bacteroidetes bacterium]|nr:DUF4270 domain-containing protein [Bacteroidota bacterium]
MLNSYAGNFPFADLITNYYFYPMILSIKRLLSAFLVAGSLAIAACGEPDAIGIEVQPQGDNINVFYTDTVTLDVTTIREDSLVTDEKVASLNLAGSYFDPVFGIHNASFFAEVKLPNNNSNFSFGTSPVLDSVVLTLGYSDYYGDTLSPMNYQVFRLTENMIADTSYYSNDQIAFSDQLFNGTVTISPKDSVELGTSTFAPHLRLRLDQNFGDAMLAADVSNYLDNAAFVNFFKGIHVKTAPAAGVNSGNIASFNLLASISRLTFYYSNSTGTGLTANFEINSTSSRFNNYTHDYSTGTFGSVFPVTGENQAYIQSMAGTKVRIKIPFLENLNALGPVSINKAELVIPVANNNPYKSHTNLLVFGVDSVGKEALIQDLLESANYYGGGFNSSTETYTFNVARYVQRVLAGTYTDYGLSLISSGGAVNAFRTIIPGPASGTGDKIQLRITYSKLN